MKNQRLTSAPAKLKISVLESTQQVDVEGGKTSPVEALLGPFQEVHRRPDPNFLGT